MRNFLKKGQTPGPGPYQDEVGLIGGEHEDGDVLLGQRGDDGLGDLGDADGLRAA